MAVVIGEITSLFDVEPLVKKAREMHEKGISDNEIADQLCISRSTVDWLLSDQALRDRTEKTFPKDIKISWRSVGVSASRIRLLASIMADIILEDMEKNNYQAETAIGIAVNGIPFANAISDILGIDFAVHLPSSKINQPGSFGMNYSSIKEKNVVFIDDVAGTGRTLREAIDSAKKEDAKIKLCVVFINKMETEDIDGIPVRSLVRTTIF
ncbi:MAG: orotate phosphoribosyltransferase-like protein [Thermoplasmata archaeon]